jgi:rSAM/selenodomain-associated transferase 1
VADSGKPLGVSGDRHGRCAVAIMAKAPRVGEAKTRLVPPLSAADAAALSACFIRDAAANIEAAARHAAIDGYIAFAPAGAEAEFRPLLAPGTRLLPSRRPGLAASLYDAATDLLGAGYGAVCLVNSDSPTLPTAILVAAVEALLPADERLVLGPAEDGGYYLIGLRRAHRRLFEDIAWSTPQVFGQTEERARELGLAVTQLPMWYDVDDRSTLQRLRSELRRTNGGPAIYPASYTSALLRRLFPFDT